MKHLVVLSICLLLLEGPLMAAQPPDSPRLDSLAWLLGHWSTTPTASVTEESWERLTDDTWEGTGRTVDAASGEVLNEESLRLVRMSGEIFYLAKVGHNELPVAFRLTAGGPDHAVFENPAHDFPKKLDYRLGDGGSLAVEVSDGGGKGFRLDFQPAP